MQLTMHCWVHKCRECPEILPNVNPRWPWRRNRNKQPDNQDDNTRYYVLSAHGYMIIVGASFVNMALNDNNCTTRPWINISMYVLIRDISGRIVNWSERSATIDCIDGRLLNSIHSFFRTTKNKCNGFHYYNTTAIAFIQLLAIV